MTEIREQKVPANGLNFHVRSAGDPADPAVILLHGSPAAGARDFQNLAPRLARDGRRVIAMDRAGWGGSERWVPSYSVKANARSAFTSQTGRQGQQAIGPFTRPFPAYRPPRFGRHIDQVFAAAGNGTFAYVQPETQLFQQRHFPPQIGQRPRIGMHKQIKQR